MYFQVHHICGVYPLVHDRHQASLLFVNGEMNVQEPAEVVWQRIAEALEVEEQ